MGNNIRIAAIMLLASIWAEASAQNIAIPELRKEYPRLVDGTETRLNVEAITKTEAGNDAMERLARRIEPFVERHQTDPEWIVGRLQMFWDTCPTDIYVNGETYSHADGKASVPTPRYSGCRSGASKYSRLPLVEIRPFQGSEGQWMKSKENGELVLVKDADAGGAVNSINREIMSLARDAAFLWWYTRDERHARFAADILDCFMRGIKYRKTPHDLNNGQQGTLVGLTSFEVIHEDICTEAAECYDYLRPYLESGSNYAGRPFDIVEYEDGFRNWCNNIIAGGVPHNNWNLIQARFILTMALVLGDDSDYADGKGRGYYLDCVYNTSSIRQWSIGKLIDFGFDARTGLWKECPGYSTMVVSEFMQFVRMTDDVLGIDLVKEHPILAKAVASVPQYLYPNGWFTAWGDTYYGTPRTDYYPAMVASSQKHGRSEDESFFTAMYRLFDPQGYETALSGGSTGRLPDKVSSFTSLRPLKVRDVDPGRIEEYVSPSFWSEGVSCFMGRTGMNKDKDLMFSVNGSEGNHMHANGINLELYGAGTVQGPDLGRGAGYTTLDYYEFYSQFPAHNTVCVDGQSSYPVMKSNHPVTLEGRWPDSNETIAETGDFGKIVYGDFSFLEPETTSDQRRQVVAILAEDGTAGYFVDIFRSARRNGQDKTHDYFYHNIGQEMELSVPTEPTEELSFAGANIYAYSYLWDKESAMMKGTVKASFKASMDDGSKSGMDVYAGNSADRRIFKAKSPYICSMTRTPVGYDVNKHPAQTMVVRQYGPAWENPFVTVFSPWSDKAEATVGAVRTENVPGAVVTRILRGSGSEDIVVSSPERRKVVTDGLSTIASFAISCSDCAFLADGTYFTDGTITVRAKSPVTVSFWKKDGKWVWSASGNCNIKIKGQR
ncbi:MAG: heparinase II/III family protein [Bacteroidales bacterium]|nr:heparinase II/III family protein [Bacteroidales bacterium]